MEKNGKLAKIYLIAVFVVLYAPIAYLIFYSFNSGGKMSHFESFTWEHYAAVFEDKRLIGIVLNTVIVALLSALISTAIGVMGAISIHYMRNKAMRNVMLSMNSILMVSPDVIIGASFLILFTLVGIKLGFASVLLSHIAFSIPIVVIMVLPKLQEMSPTLIDAALDLGATRKEIMSRVILPFIQPGIFAGFFLALTYSLDDFAVTFFVTGNGFSTLSVEIYSMARTGVTLTINALSGLIFVITAGLILGYYVLKNRPRTPASGVKR
ncbi:spermidine/putrescine ABC transporter permease [Sporosarcina sp. NCCP-2716]|uniref:ABC transporter permease n=1 Tax=Sporosarcina sp. NCCP-2716 TaxID=2943679 RepID=UPI00203B4DB7|nr:ABC transporter permease [Sporosarcina sp. NCCP-2716]GKV67651.1 spermidine/putrescine ABC transporter permease [Sporosarcina sp. NCCP-2716]